MLEKMPRSIAKPRRNVYNEVIQPQPYLSHNLTEAVSFVPRIIIIKVSGGLK